MKLKSIFYFLLIASLTSTAYAQVKIGNNPGSINSNAVLEIESTNKGLVIPRILLTAATDVVTIPSPVDGMVVYNTNPISTELSRGLVVWNSTLSRWQALSTQIASNNTINSKDLLATVTLASVPDPSAASASAASVLNFGTITLPDDGSFAFSFRLWGNRYAQGSGIYYIYLYYDGVLKDIAEMDIYGLGSASYSMTLGANGTKGQLVTVKAAKLSFSTTLEWVSNPGLSANKTSVIYWKL